MAFENLQWMYQQGKKGYGAVTSPNETVKALNKKGVEDMQRTGGIIQNTLGGAYNQLDQLGHNPVPVLNMFPKGTVTVPQVKIPSVTPASTPAPVPASESEPSSRPDFQNRKDRKAKRRQQYRDKTGPYKPDQQSFTPPGETLDGANPYPTTLDEVYRGGKGDMSPEAWGMTRLGNHGVQMGNLNTKGFDEPTDAQTLMINQSFGGEINTDLGVDYTTSPAGGTVKYADTRSKGVYNLKDAGTEPGAWMHDAGDLGIEPVMVKNENANAFQAMRGQEKDAGLVYASGKYWHEGENGKLEAITMGMTGNAGDGDIDKSGWTANRQQAMDFMKNKSASVASIQEPPTVEESGKTFSSDVPSMEGVSTDIPQADAADFSSNNSMPNTDFAFSGEVDTGVKRDISPTKWMSKDKNWWA